MYIKVNRTSGYNASAVSIGNLLSVYWPNHSKVNVNEKRRPNIEILLFLRISALPFRDTDYNQTSIEKQTRSPLGPKNNRRCLQVVIVWRYFCAIKIKNKSLNRSCLCWQLVVTIMYNIYRLLTKLLGRSIISSRTIQVIVFEHGGLVSDPW